jgi:DNA-binding transcriptional regulator YbjK
MTISIKQANNRSAPKRRVAIADAAISVLARKGSRGLTHRAVDATLDLPLGSAANYFATRSMLLSAVAERLAELDRASGTLNVNSHEPPKDMGDVAALLSALLEGWLSGVPRERQLARIELLLEATRDEKLDALFSELRKRFVNDLAGVLAELGASRAADRAASAIVVFDGLLFDQLLYQRVYLDRRHFEALILVVLESSTTAKA